MTRSLTQKTDNKLTATMRAYIDRAVAAKFAQHTETMYPRLEPADDSPSNSELANRATIVAFSGDMDKLLAAFIIATGAAAMGMEVSIFFTFWGLLALKKKTSFKGKTLTAKMMALMLPSGPANLGTSKMNMLGAGPAFFKHVMQKKNVQSLPDLISLARELGVRMVACQSSMDIMGISSDELIEPLEFGGVTTYLADASNSRVTLFI